MTIRLIHAEPLLYWQTTQDDYGRTLICPSQQSVDDFWKRGCAFEPCPNHDSVISQAVINWLVQSTGRPPPPFWWKPLQPLQRDLIDGASRSSSASGWIETLVKEGAAVDEPDGWGCTPLWWSGYYGVAVNTATLLRLGANPFQINHLVPGYTSTLHAAVSRGYTESIHLLRSYQVDPNTVDKEGRTPLFFVQKEPYYQLFNSAEVTQALLDVGANPNHRAQDGETPLAYARRMRLAEMEQILLKAGAV